MSEEEKYIPNERELKIIRLIAQKQRAKVKDISCTTLANDLGMEYQNCIDLINRLCLRGFLKMENMFSNKRKNNYSLDALSFEYESLTKKIK